MADPEIIQADVKDAGGNRLKIEWTYRAQPVTLPYFVSRTRLENYAKSVRKALMGLVHQYCEVEKRNGVRAAGATRERHRAGDEPRGHNRL